MILTFHKLTLFSSENGSDKVSVFDGFPASESNKLADLTDSISKAETQQFIGSGNELTVKFYVSKDYVSLQNIYNFIAFFLMTTNGELFFYILQGV